MSIKEEADDAYRKGDYRRALELSEELARGGDAAAIYTCAILYELGSGADSPNLDKAWIYFERLAREHHLSEGYLGCARVILSRGEQSRAKLAEEFCRRAIEIDNSAFGHLILGDIYSKFHDPPDLKRAARCYVDAAVRGAAWGWRRYANVKKAQGNFVIWALVHALATVAFPLYVLVLGARATRTG